MVCTKEGGLPAHAFVAPYLGEMYCTWAWAERQVRRVAASQETGVLAQAGCGGGPPSVDGALPYCTASNVLAAIWGPGNNCLANFAGAWQSIRRF